jgi:hypothetical protein
MTDLIALERLLRVSKGGIGFGGGTQRGLALPENRHCRIVPGAFLIMRSQPNSIQLEGSPVLRDVQ